MTTTGFRLKTRVVSVSNVPRPGVTLVDHPLLRVKLTQLRDRETVSRDFRARLAELSTLMVFEVTRDLATKMRTVQTPLARSKGPMQRPLIVAPILRAGLGMVEGMLRLLPEVPASRILACFETMRRIAPKATISKRPPHLAEADVILV